MPTALFIGEYSRDTAVEQIDKYTGLSIQDELPASDDSSNSNVETGLEHYNGELKFFVGDALAGGGVASATVKVYNGDTNADTLTTDSDGTKTTGTKYNSGDELDIKVTKGSAVYWTKYTVPQVSSSFIQSAADIGVPNIMIRLYTAWTSQFSIGGTSYDGTTVGQTNITGANNLGTGSRPGSNSFGVSVSINQGTDNKGFLSSYDPIEKYWLHTYLHVTVNGTGYETVVLTNLDHKVQLGSTMHYAEDLSDDGLTKWKVGSNYKDGFQGETSVSFTASLTGYNATSANLAIQVVTFGNWENYRENSSWGTDAVEIAGTLKSFDIIN
ncbi:hypothetical protein ACFL96_12715 [Thermoproteota archaeon]